jgi:hypothetical protein
MASPPVRRLPLPGLETLAADRIARFSKPPPLSGDIETMPSLADWVDAALRRFDAAMRKAAAGPVSVFRASRATGRATSRRPP